MYSSHCKVFKNKTHQTFTKIKCPMFDADSLGHKYQSPMSWLLSITVFTMLMRKRIEQLKDFRGRRSQKEN